MSADLIQVALGANRVLTYTGYVLLAGTLLFWVVVWPQGRSVVQLVRLVILGAVLLAIATVAGPLAQIALGGQLPGDVITSLTGAVLLVRLAALAAVAFFLPDLVREEFVGARRVVALALVVIIALTLVIQSGAMGGLGGIIASTGHVLATATWLGSLVAMAVVLRSRERLDELGRLIPRYSVVATVSVIVLGVTGVLHTLVATGSPASPTSHYGLVLLIKLLVFCATLVVGHYGRTFAARVAFRQSFAARVAFRESHATSSSSEAHDPGAHGLAVAMGVEMVLALVILTTTSVLVAFAPTI